MTSACTSLGLHLFCCVWGVEFFFFGGVCEGRRARRRTHTNNQQRPSARAHTLPLHLISPPPHTQHTQTHSAHNTQRTHRTLVIATVGSSCTSSIERCCPLATRLPQKLTAISASPPTLSTTFLFCVLFAGLVERAPLAAVSCAHAQHTTPTRAPRTSGMMPALPKTTALRRVVLLRVRWVSERTPPLRRAPHTHAHAHNTHQHTPLVRVGDEVGVVADRRRRVAADALLGLDHLVRLGGGA